MPKPPVRAVAFAALAILCACAPPRPAVSAVPAQAAAAGDCSSLHFDLLRGTLNRVPPTAPMEEVKRRLPCATGETEEGGPFNFGGGVFFLNHDFYFYTHRDYIEVRGRFPGTIAPAVLGATIVQATEALGPVARTLERRGSMLFRTAYGCAEARLARDGLRVREVAAYARPCDEVPDEA